MKSHLKDSGVQPWRWAPSLPPLNVEGVLLHELAVHSRVGDPPAAAHRANPTCSYEARAQGVKRNMRGNEARAACPDIQLVQVCLCRPLHKIETWSWSSGPP